MFCLYHGKNQFLSYREAKGKVELLSKEYPTYELVTFDAEGKDPQEIVNSYETATMFSSGKLIFIKRLYSNKMRKELTENLTTYLASKPDNVIIVLWEDQKLASNLKYSKFFAESKANYESPELNKRSFLTWATEELAKTNVKADRNVLYQLCEYVNFDEERFAQELDKIVLSEIQTLDLSYLQENSKNTLESTIWELVDAINLHNKQAAVAKLELLLDQQIDPIFIMSMLIRNNRMLIQTKLLHDSGADNSQIAKSLKMPPFIVPGLVKSAGAVGFEKLKLLHEKFYNLDFEIKVGRIDPQMGITLLTALSL